MSDVINEIEETQTNQESTHVEVAELSLDIQNVNYEAVVEGLLYLVGEDGLKLEQLAVVLEKSLEDTKVLLDNIKMKYEAPIYGFELVDYGKSYKFVTKKEVYPFAAKLFNETAKNQLSQPALETLAIIAYKQPITRVEIEELRGVGAEMMLRKLQARDLIRECGKSDAPGRPILYEVTENFMNSFKLTSLEELPDLPIFNKNQEDSEGANLFD